MGLGGIGSPEKQPNATQGLIKLLQATPSPNYSALDRRKSILKVPKKSVEASKDSHASENQRNSISTDARKEVEN